MDYGCFYKEIWAFHRKWFISLKNCSNQDERNHVCKSAMDEAGELYDSYKGQFAMDMIRAIIDELDRTERSLR